MKKSEKISFVQNLIKELETAKMAILLDYRGLTSLQINKLRANLQKAGGELAVVKNRLLKRALESAGRKIEAQIEGPTALLLSPAEDISLLKAVLREINTLGLPKFKFGFLGTQKFGGEELQRLALLPSRNQLLAQLANLLAYPPRKLVYNLNFNNLKLIILISKFKDRGSEK